MAEVASAFVSLMPSAKGFGRNLQSEVGGDVKKAGTSLGKGFGKLFAVAGGAMAAVGIGGLLKDSLGEAREAQKVGALTESIIKSTGGVANVTAGQIGKLAESISLKTGVDDEAIQSGANMLLTFKNVRNEVGEGANVFDRATQAAADLSAAGFGDLTGQSKMLGKALNDPVKGMSALSRSGVTFTADQQELIKSLVESGDTLKAQKVILGEVESQVGGAAEATATAGDKMRVAFGNVQEKIGTALLPAVDKFADFMTGTAAPAVGTFVDEAGRVADLAWGKLQSGVDALGELVGFDFSKLKFDDIKQLAKTSWGKLQSGIDALEKLTALDFSKIDGSKLGKQIGSAVRDGLGTLGAMAGDLTAKFGELFAKIDWVGIGISLGKQVPALLVGLAAGILAFDLGSLLTGLANNWGTVLIAVITLAFAPAKLVGALGRILAKIPFVGPFLARSVTWFNDIGRAFGKRVTGFMGDLGRAFTQGFGRLKIPGAGLVKNVLDAFKAIPGRVAGFFKTLETRMGVWALDAFEAMGRGARTAMGSVTKFVVGIPGMILRALGSLAKTLSPRGAELIAGLLTAARNRFASVTAYIGGTAGRVLSALGDLSRTFYNKGVELISGFASGITAKMNSAIDAVKSGLSKIKGLLPGSPIKWGPLKNWNQGGAGKRLMGLVAKGITEATPKTVKAAKSAFEKIQDQLETTRDNLRSTLDGLKGDFASIQESVASAFTGNLFDVSATLDDDGNVTKTIGQNFVENLMGKKAELTGLLASFKTLQGWGIDPTFLTKLFASGQGGLITELAGMGKAGAVDTANLFGDVTRLSNQLGAEVAANDPVASRIDETNRLLGVVSEQLLYLGGDIGKELNQAAAKADRAKKNQGKKGKG